MLENHGLNIDRYESFCACVRQLDIWQLSGGIRVTLRRSELNYSRFLRQSFAAPDPKAGKGGGKTLPLAVVLTAALR